MSRTVVLFLVLAACGKSTPHAAIAADKCASVYEPHGAPVRPERQARSNGRAEGVSRRAHERSGREVWLDRILGIEGELTPQSLKTCESIDRQAIKTKATDTETHVLGKRTAGSTSP